LLIKLKWLAPTTSPIYLCEHLPPVRMNDAEHRLNHWVIITSHIEPQSRRVRFKVMRCKVSVNNERRKMTDKLVMGDEEMLRHLSSHPEIRNRIATLLSAVDDTAGDLKLSDDAEMRLTQELQRMGQDAMQAWADKQDVRHSGRAHRSGKKTLLAHHIWRHKCARASMPKCQQENTPICSKCPSPVPRLLTPT